MMKKEYKNPSVRIIRVRPVTILAGSEKVQTSDQSATYWSPAKGTSSSLWGSEEEEIEE